MVTRFGHDFRQCTFARFGYSELTVFLPLQPMHEYRLLTLWRIAAPLAQVFDAVFDSLSWPNWWPGAAGAVQIHPGDAQGIGSIRLYTWKGGLPYRVSFSACATRIETHSLLEAEVDGDLRGRGCWIFSHDAGITTVRYEWCVCTTKPWMNALAPLAHGVFTDNHHALMRSGGEALARLLGTRLVDAHYGSLPPMDARKADGAAPNWLVAAGAGIAGGTIATLVQIGLWWSASLPAVELLLRDARLAAAIVMGRGVLPPPASFDWTVMLVATLLHFALSTAYGLLLAPLIAGARLFAAAMTGLFFGLILFGTNMYVFTLLFPWFEASRDWITAVTHAAFGVIIAVTYKWGEYRLGR